jgi:hypothetical protein
MPNHFCAFSNLVIEVTVRKTSKATIFVLRNQSREFCAKISINYKSGKSVRIIKKTRNAEHNTKYKKNLLASTV